MSGPLLAPLFPYVATPPLSGIYLSQSLLNQVVTDHEHAHVMGNCINVLRDNLQSVMNQVYSIRCSLQTVQGDVLMLNTDVSQEKVNTDSLKTRITHLEGLNSGLTAKLTASALEVTAVKADLASAKIKTDLLQTQLTKLQDLQERDQTTVLKQIAVLQAELDKVTRAGFPAAPGTGFSSIASHLTSGMSSPTLSDFDIDT